MILSVTLTHLSLSAVYYFAEGHASVECDKPNWADLLWGQSNRSVCPAWSKMELKVWVDGVVRVVCGLSQETSCQDVVIALAQAIGEYFSLYSYCPPRIAYCICIFFFSFFTVCLKTLSNLHYEIVVTSKGEDILFFLLFISLHWPESSP